jgi:hypothetical protein
VKPAKPQQAWFSWDLDAERDRKAQAFREAFRAAWPGGARVWLSRPKAPPPASEEGRAHQRLVGAADAAALELRRLPGGAGLWHRIRWEEWHGKPLEDESPAVEPAQDEEGSS